MQVMEYQGARFWTIQQPQGPMFAVRAALDTMSRAIATSSRPAVFDSVANAVASVRRRAEVAVRAAVWPGLLPLLSPAAQSLLPQFPRVQPLLAACLLC